MIHTSPILSKQQENETIHTCHSPVCKLCTFSPTPLFPIKTPKTKLGSLFTTLDLNEPTSHSRHKKNSSPNSPLSIHSNLQKTLSSESPSNNPVPLLLGKKMNCRCFSSSQIALSFSPSPSSLLTRSEVTRGITPSRRHTSQTLVDPTVYLETPVIKKTLSSNTIFAPTLDDDDDDDDDNNNNNNNNNNNKDEEEEEKEYIDNDGHKGLLKWGEKKETEKKERRNCTVKYISSDDQIRTKLKTMKDYQVNNREEKLRQLHELHERTNKEIHAMQQSFSKQLTVKEQETSTVLQQIKNNHIQLASKLASSFQKCKKDFNRIIELKEVEISPETKPSRQPDENTQPHKDGFSKSEAPEQPPKDSFGSVGQQQLLKKKQPNIFQQKPPDQNQHNIFQQKSSNQDQQTTLQPKDKQTSKQHLHAFQGVIMSRTAAEEYDHRMELLTKIEGVLKPLKSSPEFPGIKREYYRRINLAIIQISNDAHQVAKKAQDLIAILNETSSNPNPTVHIYCLSAIAGRLVEQGETQVHVHQSSAYPIAYVIVSLVHHYPALLPIILAMFHQVCPYTVPQYRHFREGENMREYLLKKGYKETGATTFETEDSYQERMAGFLSLYSAIIQTTIPNIPNLFGLKNGWVWFSRILNMKPQRISPTVILPFLEVCSHAMQRTYRAQFHKLIILLNDAYIPLLPPKCEASKTRLVVFLETYEKYRSKGQYLPPPEGCKLKTNVLSG